MMIVPDLWRAAARSRRRLSTSALLQLAIYGTHLAQAGALAVALAALVAGNIERALASALGVLGVGLLRLLLSVAQARTAAAHGTEVRDRLRSAALRAALVPRRLHDLSQRDGATHVALADGIDGVDTYVSKYIPAVIQLLMGSVIAVAFLAVLSPTAAAGVALGICLAILGPLGWKRMLARRGLSHWDSYEALSADLLEALRGMPTLRMLGAVGSTRAHLHGRSEELRHATERVMRASLAETAITDLAVQAGVVAAAMLAVVSATTGNSPAVEVYALLLLSSEAFRPVRDLSRQWHAGFLGVSAVPGLVAIGAFEAAQAAESPAAVNRHASPRLRSTSGESLLRVTGVTYRYPDSDQAIIRDLDLQVGVGTVHAIAGPSGAGKSTLFDLLLGFLRPDAGSVELDGRPLRTADIAVLSQRPVLFVGTIRENIDLDGVDDESVRAACAAAGILGEILAMPQGFDTPVAEAGSSLSGGQRQRLALARALLADRPVLLVDEPTSGLDETGAETVADTLDRVARERIVLMISHRTEALARIAEVHHLRDGRLERAHA